MTAAAQHLTPVTLELGGKSPVIVDASADLDVAAKRIVWGKYLNAGQTCIAPDYVLVDRRVEAPAARPHDRRGARRSTAPTRARAPTSGGSSTSGTSTASPASPTPTAPATSCSAASATGRRRYYAPTALRGTRTPTSAIMQEEIFGPLLPTLPVDDLDDAIEFVTARDKPLALYLFAEDAAGRAAVLDRTTSGGVCVNATLFHFTVPGLPFGGVGESGMGAYHGRATFDTFTHRKSVLSRPTRLDPSIAYPAVLAAEGEAAEEVPVKVALHHVALDVDDLDAALRFYVDGLGFTELRRPDFGFPGVRGSTWATTSSTSSRSPGPMPPNGGAHFALHVEDRDAAVDALRAKGITVRPGPRGAGRGPPGVPQRSGRQPHRAEPADRPGAVSDTLEDGWLPDHAAGRHRPARLRDSAVHYLVDVGRAVGARDRSSTTTSRARTTARTFPFANMGVVRRPLDRDGLGGALARTPRRVRGPRAVRARVTVPHPRPRGDRCELIGHPPFMTRAAGPAAVPDARRPRDRRGDARRRSSRLRGDARRGVPGRRRRLAVHPADPRRRGRHAVARAPRRRAGRHRARPPRRDASTASRSSPAIRGARGRRVGEAVTWLPDARAARPSRPRSSRATSAGRSTSAWATWRCCAFTLWLSPT